MPARGLCIAIVAFWLTAVGWLVLRDIWPELQPDTPPPFKLDFLDEIEIDRPSDITWKVWHNDNPVDEYHTTTKVTHHKEDDTFEMSSIMKINFARTSEDRLRGGLYRVRHVKSSTRVTRDGDLRHMHAEAEIEIPSPPKWAPVKVWADGEVQAGQLDVHVKMDLPRLDRHEFVPVPPRGSVLTPLQPIHRILGLRPGQLWRQPLVDPLSEALAARFAGFRNRPQALDAHVRPQPANLYWRDQDVPCLVIEYFQGEDEKGRTWVEQDGGRVLRQEFSAEPDRWVLERER
jgi:hypothetical protein